jgi:hypothetical protein
MKSPALPPFWKLRPSVPKGWRNAGSARWNWSAPGEWQKTRRRLRALGRSFHPFAATEFDAARCRRDFPETDGRPSPRLDFYLGDPWRTGQVSPLLRELGLGEPESACWESPFDYGKQAMLYAPLGMPEPNSYGYTDAVVDAAFPAVLAAGGGAFFLCTSLRAMRRTHELIKARLEDEGHDLPLADAGRGQQE